MFAKLHLIGGEALWVNPEHVAAVMDKGDRSHVFLNGRDNGYIIKGGGAVTMDILQGKE